MSHKRTEEMAVGQDSFLDTTANLVGILIILVVVIGTKTKLDAVEYGKQRAAEETPAEITAARREAGGLVQSLGRQATQTAEYELELQYRKLERDRLLEKVTIARDIVAEQIQDLDAKRREQLEQATKIEDLRSELADVEQQMGEADESERPTVVLEHLPTPMARTVFTKEMHIQLKDGLVTVVPWDRLVQTLKDQVPLALRRNGSRKNIEDTLGPVGGFLMHYRMLAVPGGFELERFELEPTPTAASETLNEALSPAGRLRLELASRDPSETVITVWVYPDSFQQFRGLKSAIFEQGFLSAARPLPFGVRIGASPKGSRSSAQ